MHLHIVCTFPTDDMSIGGKMEDFIDRHDAQPDIREGQATFVIPLHKPGEADEILLEFRTSLPAIFRPAKCAATITFDPIDIT